MTTEGLSFHISMSGEYGDDAILYGIFCQYGKATASLEVWVVLCNEQGLPEVTIRNAGYSFYEQIFGLPFKTVADAAYDFLQKQHPLESAVFHIDRSGVMDRAEVEARVAELARRPPPTEDDFFVTSLDECRKPS